MELHLRATGCHLLYGITVSPDTSEHTPALTLARLDRPVLDLPTQEGWKAELVLFWTLTDLWFIDTSW